MPTPTYVAIAKTVLTGNATTITFSSIPSTYTDLVVLISARQDVASYYQALRMTFNGDSTTNYSSTNLEGQGTTSASGRFSSGTFIYVQGITGASATANSFSSTEIYIPNYTGTTAKAISITNVEETNDATNNNIINIAALYRGTSAISSITLVTASTNLVSGSRFDLYGIKNS